jgi:hypothetical protein
MYALDQDGIAVAQIDLEWFAPAGGIQVNLHAEEIPHRAEAFVHVKGASLRIIRVKNIVKGSRSIRGSPVRNLSGTGIQTA